MGDFVTGDLAWGIAGIAANLAIALAIYNVSTHLRNYHAPRLQIWTIRIIVIVPVYAIGSWLSLRYHDEVRRSNFVVRTSGAACPCFVLRPCRHLLAIQLLCVCGMYRIAQAIYFNTIRDVYEARSPDTLSCCFHSVRMCLFPEPAITVSRWYSYLYGAPQAYIIYCFIALMLAYGGGEK